MEFRNVIRNRLDGKNSDEELRLVAQGAADGSVPDYQLSAWLMAAYCRPLSIDETAALTVAMANSGQRIDLTGLPRPWVDKHSTGGVGDKTSLVVLPLLAACGITIVKMSGRGLGITGGTVDKLESIPGFRMDLTPEEMKAQAKEIGIAITGQSQDLAPADKALYAIRDVTATVDSIPLIVSSILSKKIAGGAEIVVLDVKCGSGAFMTNLERASELAQALVLIGNRAGLSTHAVITDMSQPLGRAVGNILEVREAVEILTGGIGRFAELCVALAAHTLVAAGKAADSDEATRLARETLSSGRAADEAKQWFRTQGATLDVFNDRLPEAPIKLVVNNTFGNGWVEQVDASVVGKTVVALGGGRENKSDTIDPLVGVECLKHVADTVQEGEPLFVVHASTEKAAQAACANLLSAISVSSRSVPEPPLILNTYG
jgi:pyrimidine-nucleoside phosphorylase